MTTPRDEATALLAEALAVALRGDPTPGYQHTPRSDRDYEALVGRAFDHSPTLAADLEFAAAWRRVERALPEGWAINMLWGTVTEDRWGAHAGPFPAVAGQYTQSATAGGPTPTAALTRLAEALEAMR